MKEKNMPGFTAEASLYKSEKLYTAAATNTAPSTQQVVPQYGFCDKAAYYCNRGYQNWCDALDRVCLPEP
jgi:hypothetical protein